MNRLFFALWPDATLCEQIDAIQPHIGNIGGRLVAKKNYHITLAFMARVSDRQWQRLEMDAATTSFQGFDLQLDQLGYWERSQVMWLGCQHPPQGLLNLVDGLKLMLHQVGLPTEQRPYQPHLTLRSKMTQAPPIQQIAPIEWPVREFALSRSIPQQHGPEYQVIGRWPLNR